MWDLSKFKDEIRKINERNYLELWLVPQLFKGEPDVDFRMTERHHTPPMNE
jgi:hypothetical protein